MEQYIIVYSKYFITLFMGVYTALSFPALLFKNEKEGKALYICQYILLFLIQFTAFLTICIRTGSTDYLFFYALLQIAIFAALMLFPMIYTHVNQLLVNHMCMLLGIGFIILARLDLQKAVKQLVIAGVSMAVALAVPALMQRFDFLRSIPWAYAAAGLAALSIVLILGQVTHGSKISFTVAGITFQPSEFVKILFVFLTASLLWKEASFGKVLISGALAAAHVLVLVLSKDLGSALIFFIAYVFLVYIASGHLYYLAGGLAAGAAASYVAYLLFSHVQVRVQAWRDPWSVIDREGYQIAQSLFALGRGSWFGLGLTQGTPKDIPYVETDFIFASITEEMGILFAVCMILVCVNCFLSFIKIALRSQDRFHRLLASGIGIMYIFQIFLTVGGGTKFIPLTGVTLPLISYGGSSVLTTLIMFAVVQSVYIMDRKEELRIERQRRKEAKRAEARKNKQRAGAEGESGEEAGE